MSVDVSGALLGIVDMLRSGDDGDGDAPKRVRGRPKGSKNRAKRPRSAMEDEADEDGGGGTGDAPPVPARTRTRTVKPTARVLSAAESAAALRSSEEKEKDARRQAMEQPATGADGKPAPPKKRRGRPKKEDVENASARAAAMQAASQPNTEVARSLARQKVIREAFEDKTRRKSYSVGNIKRWQKDLPEAPVFTPTTEEFEDPIKYIESIAAQIEPFGIARIKPPASWKALELGIDRTKFQVRTRLQSVDQWQHRTRWADDGEFGVEEGRTFTLPAYKAMADNFKRVAAGKLDVSIAELEECFWTVVENASPVVEVEYGNDLNLAELLPDSLPTWSPFESGTPTSADWNLARIARAPGSLLRQIMANVAGVTSPWLYVGMLYSTFCWHVEDHYLPSINYLHEGEAKVWYGVAPDHAIDFERVMKEAYPGLFESAPDLLFRNVTLLSPGYLAQNGVPVCRAVQQENEFIVTMPRSYHAGFNSGFNMASAVNLAFGRWINLGRHAIKRYRRFARAAIFSHEELLMTMASMRAEDLPRNLRETLAVELHKIYKTEAKTRWELKNRGLSFRFVTPMQKHRYYVNLLDHNSSVEHATCAVCSQFCFFSAVGCGKCEGSKRIACLAHVDKLCTCAATDKFFIVIHTMPDILNAIREIAPADTSLDLAADPEREGDPEFRRKRKEEKRRAKEEEAKRMLDAMAQEAAANAALQAEADAKRQADEQARKVLEAERAVREAESRKRTDWLENAPDVELPVIKPIFRDVFAGTADEVLAAKAKGRGRGKGKGKGKGKGTDEEKDEEKDEENDEEMDEEKDEEAHPPRYEAVLAHERRTRDEDLGWLIGGGINSISDIIGLPPSFRPPSPHSKEAGALVRNVCRQIRVDVTGDNGVRKVRRAKASYDSYNEPTYDVDWLGVASTKYPGPELINVVAVPSGEREPREPDSYSMPESVDIAKGTCFLGSIAFRPKENFVQP